MTSPDQFPSSSPPPEVTRLTASHTAARTSLFAQRVQWMAGSVTWIILGLTALLILVDWLVGWHLSRAWLQVSAAIGGTVLLISAVALAAQSYPRRVILSIGGLLLIFAVLDSLDGQQDILTQFVILLFAWALIFADATAQLLQSGTPTTLRQWIAISIGVVGTLVYFGASCYYSIVNLTIAPINPDQHPLFGFGLLINFLIRWIGGISPYSAELTGSIRLCPSCGLRNIHERRTCKRCGARLGPVEQVS